MSDTKSLHNTDIKDVQLTTPDILVTGDGNLFKVLSKASSNSQKWMKSTKAMEIEGTGCLVQVTTQLTNPDGSYSVAEALQFVPDVKIVDDENNGRKLVSIFEDSFELDDEDEDVEELLMSDDDYEDPTRMDLSNIDEVLSQNKELGPIYFSPIDLFSMISELNKNNKLLESKLNSLDDNINARLTSELESFKTSLALITTNITSFIKNFSPKTED